MINIIVEQKLVCPIQFQFLLVSLNLNVLF